MFQEKAYEVHRRFLRLTELLNSASVGSLGITLVSCPINPHAENTDASFLSKLQLSIRIRPKFKPFLPEQIGNNLPTCESPLCVSNMLGTIL